MENESTTIVAISSALGAAPRVVLRISGTRTGEFVRRFFAPRGSNDDVTAATGPVAISGNVAWDPGDGISGCNHRAVRRVPAELFFWPDHRSYTGESCAELHVPGSPVMAESLVAALCATGARPAMPGEFTMRAFRHGRLDLVRAEAVLATIDAGDDRSLRTALAQLSGSLSGGLEHLRESAADLVARLEAAFDFADEPMTFIEEDELRRTLGSLRTEVVRLAEIAGSTADADRPVRIVLAGRPNAGKSSLFNRLTGSDAIVSPHAGTTRDYTMAPIRMGSGKWTESGNRKKSESGGGENRMWRGVLLVDVAGMTDGDSEEWGSDADSGNGGAPESRSHAAARRQLELADLVVLCLDASTPNHHADDLRRFRASHDDRTLCILTKCDCMIPAATADAANKTTTALRVSVVTETGLGRLRRELRRRVWRIRATRGSGSGDIVPATAIRCRDSLRRAIEAMDAAIELCNTGPGDELAAVELRRFLNAIGELTGAVPTDELLGRIFSRFCVGK